MKRARLVPNLMMSLTFAGMALAQSLKITDTNPSEGALSLEWGPPIGWSANVGGVCGDDNDEDPTLACIHVGVPEGASSIEFSGAVDVSGLDSGLKLVVWLATLNESFTAVGISETAEFPGGTPGYQTFHLAGTITSEDGTWFVIPVFKIRVIGKPDNSLAGNEDCTSVVFIDDLSLTYNNHGNNLFSNGGWETGDLSESYSSFLNANAWFPPDCVSAAAAAKVRHEATEKTNAANVTAPTVSAKTVMVSMRDGTRLATDVHLPSRGGPAFPVVLVRTTYGRKNIGFAVGLNAAGMVVVTQDTRGHGDSEGKNMAFAPDGWGREQDGVDTVAWIKSQAWCNGRIGTWGSSALGITQVLMAPATSSITCQAIIMAPSNFYHVFYPGGVPRKVLPEAYAKVIGHEDALKTRRSHPAYDAFWTYYNAEARAGDITAPAVHVGGWFDLYLQGVINNFVTRQYRGGEGAKGNQKLIMGPWPHGVSQKVGELTFPDNYNFDWENYIWRFFRYWLQDERNGIMDEPAVHYYVMGDCDDPDGPGNEWRTADGWPPYPTAETPYYLMGSGRLSDKPPKAENARLSYDFDPADPCPSHGGTNHLIASGPLDQRVVSSRPDVLTFETAPLAQPLEVTGAIRVKLCVSSDAPDTDFTARLVDIYPDGREMLMADGIQRVKFRNGFEKADPLPAGAIGELEIDLWSLSLIFNKGHKIGIQISSSNFPRCEVNPNTGEDLPRYLGQSEAGDKMIDKESVRVAHNTVYMDRAHPSALFLPVRSEPEQEE